MSIGLVLEGGGTRGMYTAGVLDVLMDKGIEADKIVGASAGALFGVNFLSKQRGRALRYNKRFNADKNYMGLLPLIKEGNIVSTRYAYDDVPHRLDPFDDEAFKRSGVPFYAVCTNVSTGRAEYIQVKSVFEDMDVLRASGSLPLVSKPVELAGQKYLDGGIADSIPFKWLASQGCDKLIVVLTRDISYRKTASRGGEAYKLKYPEIARLMESRHIRYNASLYDLARWEKDGRAFVIRPSSPVEVGRLEGDPDKLQAAYDLGVKDTENIIEKLIEYIRA